MYDLETFLKEFESVFKTNLNTKIIALNTEKGDFTIEQINDNAWYFGNINSSVFSYPQFAVWGIDNTSRERVESQQFDNFIKTIQVYIEIVIADTGELDTPNMMWRMLRYTRCLESIAFQNFDKFQGKAKMTIENLLPTSFEIDGKIFRSAGISLTARMTAY